MKNFIRYLDWIKTTAWITFGVAAAFLVIYSFNEHRVTWAMVLAGFTFIAAFWHIALRRILQDEAD